MPTFTTLTGRLDGDEWRSVGAWWATAGTAEEVEEDAIFGLPEMGDPVRVVVWAGADTTAPPIIDHAYCCSDCARLPKFST